MLLNRNAVYGALLLILLLVSARTHGQSPGTGAQSPSVPSPQSESQSRPHTDQSVVVSVKETPEEAEEGKLNDAYQPPYQLEEHHECDGAIEKYKAVILLAEQAKFDMPRNKFLYLSYRGIGDCDLSAGQFAEAEESFQKILAYIPVWPGTDDSDYPIDFVSIAEARMGQQNWKGAEESLQEALTVFDQQIDSAVHSDSDFMRTQQANHLRASEDEALNFLAVAYFRDQRSAESLPLLERAFNQAVKYSAPSDILNTIVANGVAVSAAVGDDSTKAKWAERAKASN